MNDEYRTLFLELVVKAVGTNVIIVKEVLKISECENNIRWLNKNV